MDRFLDSFRLTVAYPRVLVWVSCCSSFTIPLCLRFIERPLSQGQLGALAMTTATATRTSKINRFYYAKQQLCTLFLYISLPSLHDYDVKMANCKFYGGRKQATTNLFFSLNLSAVLKKLTPGKFAYTCHFQQIGINATN